ncbi:MAG: polymer-forming cytoskeletal protein [Nitrospirae bacterium]|nr:polymer-forming cytoskeletal protein [Nitrospirota bacterium]
MFHKNTEKLESFIGANSTFRGDVETKGTLRVDGVIEGNIVSDWVILGESSHIKGDITSRGIVIGGRVDGNIKAKEIVEIKNKGQLHGEIFTSKLVIAEGGILEGRTRMQQHEESKVIEFQPMERSKQG